MKSNGRKGSSESEKSGEYQTYLRSTGYQAEVWARSHLRNTRTMDGISTDAEQALIAAELQNGELRNEISSLEQRLQKAKMVSYHLRSPVNN